MYLKVKIIVFFKWCEKPIFFWMNILPINKTVDKKKNLLS
jgi:hypothetical protein